MIRYKFKTLQNYKMYGNIKKNQIIIGYLLNVELEPTGFIEPAHCNSYFFVSIKSDNPAIH